MHLLFWMSRVENVDENRGKFDSVIWVKELPPNESNITANEYLVIVCVNFVVGIFIYLAYKNIYRTRKCRQDFFDDIWNES